MTNLPQNPPDFTELSLKIKSYAKELGFSALAITDIDLAQAEHRLLDWLAKGYHGQMQYMSAHGVKRARPQELLPGTIRAICVRMDYLQPNTDIPSNLLDKAKAYIARYALGRDYHRLIRKRLAKLTTWLEACVDGFNYRVFCDSAPVMEKPLAEKAGLGWIGKSTNLIDKDNGTWFFLGTIYTDLPLPIDKPQSNRCGQCQDCIDICPTQAIVAPYQLDARRCIAYLTIEYRGTIPEPLRPLIGNRIFGCDDCQWICPWNKFAKITTVQDFHPRHQLNNIQLLELFAWSEADFKKNTIGSAIARIGYECWLRNIAVALGNANTEPAIIRALENRLHYPSRVVNEHVEWALLQHKKI